MRKTGDGKAQSVNIPPNPEHTTLTSHHLGGLVLGWGGGGAESGHRGSLLSLPLCTALKKALLQPPPCRCCSSRISLQLALVAVMGPDLLTA